MGWSESVVHSLAYGLSWVVRELVLSDYVREELSGGWNWCGFGAGETVVGRSQPGCEELARGDWGAKLAWRVRHCVGCGDAAGGKRMRGPLRL